MQLKPCLWYRVNIFVWMAGCSFLPGLVDSPNLNQTAESPHTLAQDGHVRMIMYLSEDELACITHEGNLAHWDLKKNARAFTFRADRRNESFGLRSSDKLFLVPGHVGVLFVTTDGKDKKELVTNNKELVDTICFSQSRSGKLAAMAQRDLRLINKEVPTFYIGMFDFKSLTVTEKLFFHKGAIDALAFSHDDKYIASTGQDRAVFVWDIAQRKLVHRIDFDGEMFNDGVYVSFSPCGKFLAYSDNVSTVLLTTKEYKFVKRWSLKEGAGACFDFSPNGKHLALGGNRFNDFVATLWDLDNPKEIKLIESFKGHKGLVYGLAFSPSGRKLATGGNDKTIKIWKLKATD